MHAIFLCSRSGPGNVGGHGELGAGSPMRAPLLLDFTCSRINILRARIAPVYPGGAQVGEAEMKEGERVTTSSALGGAHSSGAGAGMLRRRGCHSSCSAMPKVMSVSEF